MSGAPCDRLLEVTARLDRVTDPELDEPLTRLGFIDKVDVDGAAVHVRFRLPTYWCAANFAFMMADDMRHEVMALPWVRAVTVQLDEHMYAEKINEGLRQGLSFKEAFGTDAAENLESLRKTFLQKSFQRRQEQVLSGLLCEGNAAADLVTMSVGGLRARALDADSELGRLASAYLERRGVPGAFADDDPAFVAVSGERLSGAELGPYLRRLRNVVVNIEFNGALCRGLLAARFDEEQPSDRQPELRDFVRQAAHQQLR